MQNIITKIPNFTFLFFSYCKSLIEHDMEDSKNCMKKVNNSPFTIKPMHVLGLNICFLHKLTLFRPMGEIYIHNLMH